MVSLYCLFSKVQRHPPRGPPTLHSCGICLAARWGGRCGKTELDAKEPLETLFLRGLDHALDYSSLKFLPGLCWHHLKCPSVLHALPTDWIPLKTPSGELLWKSEITMTSKLADSLLLDLLDYVCIICLTTWGGNLICIVHDWISQHPGLFHTKTHLTNEWLSQASWAAIWGCILALLRCHCSNEKLT